MRINVNFLPDKFPELEHEYWKYNFSIDISTQTEAEAQAEAHKGKKGTAHERALKSRRASGTRASKRTDLRSTKHAVICTQSVKAGTGVPLYEYMYNVRLLLYAL